MLRGWRKWALRIAGVAAAGLALVSLVLALLVPRHPQAGNETVFSIRAVAAE